MEYSPSWEADRASAGQEIPHILWSLKVDYCIHKLPAFAPILSHISPACALPSHFLKTHFNIIPPPSTPGSSKWSPSVKSPHQNPLFNSPLPHKCYVSHPSNSSWFDDPKSIWWVQIGSSSLCSVLHSHVTSFLFGPDSLLRTPFSNILNTFVPQCEWPSFMPIQNNTQNYSSVYLSLYIFG